MLKLKQEVSYLWIREIERERGDLDKAFLINKQYKSDLASTSRLKRYHFVVMALY